MPAKLITHCRAGLAPVTPPHLLIAPGSKASVRAEAESVSKPPKLHRYSKPDFAGLGLQVLVSQAWRFQATHAVACSSSRDFLLAAEHDLITGAEPVGAELLGGRMACGMVRSRGYRPLSSSRA